MLKADVMGLYQGRYDKFGVPVRMLRIRMSQD